MILLETSNEINNGKLNNKKKILLLLKGPGYFFK